MEMNLSDITAHWVALHEALGLGGALRDEAHYGQLLEVAESLMENAAALDGSPVSGLAALIGDRIYEYENRVHPWPDTSTPATRLAFLMDQHGLLQSELPEVGAQSVVSAVLSGKRALNLRQTQALALRFGVPMEALAT
jgi:HTH-type transcriptional regulator/antitoxin HigA